MSLTHQLKQQIEWFIASGELHSGDNLPSLRQVADHLSINLHTVRSAYKLLEMEGIVETRQGRETRVLGYDPRRVTSGIASVRTNTIGVILASLINPFYHSFLQGLSGESERSQTLMFVCNTQDDPLEAWRYFLQLTAKQVDGIVVASHDLEDLLDEQTKNSRSQSHTIPYVMVDAPLTRGPAVLLDLQGAGIQATRHLIEHGHRRIGLITFFLDAPNVSPINEGYIQALHEAGLSVDLALIARVQSFDFAAGSDGVRRLMSLREPPTAIFAITDLMAAGAMQTLKELGYQIPQDVALIGFNDIPLAGMVDPPLTTVAAPSYEMGITAMRMLQTLIAGKKVSQQHVVFPTSLVIRKSCGSHTNH